MPDSKNSIWGHVCLKITQARTPPIHVRRNKARVNITQANTGEKLKGVFCDGESSGSSTLLRCCSTCRDGVPVLSTERHPRGAFSQYALHGWVPPWKKCMPETREQRYAEWQTWPQLRPSGNQLAHVQTDSHTATYVNSHSEQKTKLWSGNSLLLCKRKHNEGDK